MPIFCYFLMQTTGRSDKRGALDDAAIELVNEKDGVPTMRDVSSKQEILLEIEGEHHHAARCL